MSSHFMAFRFPSKNLSRVMVCVPILILLPLFRSTVSSVSEGTGLSFTWGGYCVRGHKGHVTSGDTTRCCDGHHVTKLSQWGHVTTCILATTCARIMDSFYYRHDTMYRRWEIWIFRWYAEQWKLKIKTRIGIAESLSAEIFLTWKFPDRQYVF